MDETAVIIQFRQWLRQRVGGTPGPAAP
jgi:hypothetical protein